MLKTHRLSFTYILLTSFIFALNTKTDGEKQKNVDQFFIGSYLSAHNSKDSVRIKTYFIIPYSALQFVKAGKGYQARYEASLVILDAKGNQVNRAVWYDSVEVSDYLNTISHLSNITYQTEFVVIAQSYKLIGELVDLDTKNSGSKSMMVDASGYTKIVDLFPPIILVNKNGDWGFGRNKIPALQNILDQIEGDIQLYISGKVKPGRFKLQLAIKSNDGKVLWKTEKKLKSKTTGFIYRTTIPRLAIDGIRFQIVAQITQGIHKKKETIEFAVKKEGISPLVSDISEAIEQMNYILTSEEKEKLKKASWREKEKLFRAFWKDRDPTPNSFYNELMEEYYGRIKYSNDRFTGFQPGWRTDMGMVYILLGPPDDVERLAMPRRQESYETWYYYQINQKFTFVDENGFGEYRLKSPFYGNLGRW